MALALGPPVSIHDTHRDDDGNGDADTNTDTNTYTPAETL